MRNAILSGLLLLFSCSLLLAQDDIYPQPRPKNCDNENSCPRNTLFHETTFRFGGLGFNWNSLNWDHLLICRESYLLSFRIGINYFTFSKLASVGAPIDLNLSIGRGPLMAEISAGLNYHYVYKNYDTITHHRFDDKLNYLAAKGRIGLRYQKKHSIFFRAGYTPMYSIFGNDEILVKTKDRPKRNKKGVAIIHDRPFYSMYSVGIGYTF